MTDQGASPQLTLPDTTQNMLTIFPNLDGDFPSLEYASPAYQKLLAQIGSSAATTYYWLRNKHHIPAKNALNLARMQFKNYGAYPDMDAIRIYRSPDRFQRELDRIFQAPQARIMPDYTWTK